MYLFLEDLKVDVFYYAFIINSNLSKDVSNSLLKPGINIYMGQNKLHSKAIPIPLYQQDEGNAVLRKCKAQRLQVQFTVYRGHYLHQHTQ